MQRTRLYSRGADQRPKFESLDSAAYMCRERQRERERLLNPKVVLSKFAAKTLVTWLRRIRHVRKEKEGNKMSKE